jgi:hypothetical protein
VANRSGNADCRDPVTVHASIVFSADIRRAKLQSLKAEDAARGRMVEGDGLPYDIHRAPRHAQGDAVRRGLPY